MKVLGWDGEIRRGDGLEQGSAAIVVVLVKKKKDIEMCCKFKFYI